MHRQCAFADVREEVYGSCLNAFVYMQASVEEMMQGRVYAGT